MVQPGPDTSPSTANFAGGYSAGDRSIRGFSLTHFSGAGCTGFRDVPLIPTTAAVDVAPHEPGSSDLRPRYLARFDHRHERARPGDYRVTLDPGTGRAIRTEVTATTRVAVLRLRFPRTRDGQRPRRPRRRGARQRPRARARGPRAPRGHRRGRERLVLLPARALPALLRGPLRPAADALGHLDRAAAGPPGSQGGGRPLRRHALQLVADPDRAAHPPGEPEHDRAGGRLRDVRRAARPDRRRSASRCPPSASGPPGARSRTRRRGGGPSRRCAPPRGPGGPGCWTASASRAAAAPTASSWGRRCTTRSCTRARGRTPTAATAAWTAACTAPAASRRSRTSRAGTSTAARSSSWRCSPRRHADDLAASLVADARESRVPAALAGGERPDERHGGRPRGADPRLARRARRRAAHRPGGAARDGARRDGAVPHAHRRRHRARGPRGRPAPRLRPLRPPGRRDRPHADGARRAVGLGGHDAGGRDRRLRDRADGRPPRRRRHRPADAPPRRAVARPARPRRAPRAPAPRRRLVRAGDARQRRRLRGGQRRAVHVARAARPGGPGLGARRPRRRGAPPGRVLRGAQRRAGQRARLPRQRAGAGDPVALRLARAAVAHPGRRAAGAAGLYRPTPGGMPGNDDGGTLSAWWAFGALGLYPAVPGEDVLVVGSPLFRRVVLRLPRVGTVRIDAPRAARGRPYVHGLRSTGRRTGARGCACATCAGARGCASRWARGPTAPGAPAPRTRRRPSRLRGRGPG